MVISKFVVVSQGVGTWLFYFGQFPKLLVAGTIGEQKLPVQFKG